LKTIEAQTVLKLTDFRRNPLDFVQYPKPSKKVKEEFMFQQLKKQFVNGFFSLNDYMYTVAANLQTIDYITEWLVVEDLEDGDELTCLNNAFIDTSIEEGSNTIEETNTTAEARALLLAELESGV